MRTVTGLVPTCIRLAAYPLARAIGQSDVDFVSEKEPQSNVNCATTEFDLWLYNIYCPESSPCFRWHVN